jgi:hypothetical protein
MMTEGTAYVGRLFSRVAITIAGSSYRKEERKKGRKEERKKGGKETKGRERKGREGSDGMGR